MSETVMVTTGGFIPGESDRYTENVAEVDKTTLFQSLPQMLNCFFDPLVPQIEDPKHPLNGWQVHSICIESSDIGRDAEIDDIDERENR